MNRAELLAKIHQGWDEFQTYLQTLTEEQLTVPTDAAGWTAKDHISHLAVWEDGITALLQKQSRRERMGLDQETWDSRDFDRMNAVIQQRHRDLSLADTLAMFRRVHEGLLAQVEKLSDEDLQRPYRYYQPDSTQEKPVIEWIEGDTYAHYAEHRPWIEAIVR